MIYLSAIGFQLAKKFVDKKVHIVSEIMLAICTPWVYTKEVVKGSHTKITRRKKMKKIYEVYYTNNRGVYCMKAVEEF